MSYESKSEHEASVVCPRCNGSRYFPARAYYIDGPLMSRCMRCGFSVVAPLYVPLYRNVDKLNTKCANMNTHCKAVM